MVLPGLRDDAEFERSGGVPELWIIRVGDAAAYCSDASQVPGEAAVSPAEIEGLDPDQFLFEPHENELQCQFVGKHDHCWWVASGPIGHLEIAMALGHADSHDW